MMTEEEASALLRELDGIIDCDRYFLSPRIKTLKAIRAKIRTRTGAGASATATEAICAAEGDSNEETTFRTPSPMGKRAGTTRSKR
jgi:hypothetical protein